MAHHPNQSNYIEFGKLMWNFEYLLVATAIFAIEVDVVHHPVAATVRPARESPVARAASVFPPIFSNKSLASHTSVTHHRFAAAPTNMMKKMTMN